MGHKHDNSAIKNIKMAFWVNLCFSILEFFGGIYVNSVAIISDAVHDFGDSLSFASAWYLEKKSEKKPDAKYTFGYRRFSLLGALLNSLILIIGSGIVLYMAGRRLFHPEESDAQGMIVFAIIGVAVNGFVALKMSKSSSLNEKVVFWHMMEDVLGWVAVLIAAIVIWIYPTPYIDPILSIGITVYILWGVFGRLKETLYFFLQGIPREIDMEKIKDEIEQIPNVKSLHHTHAWSLDGEKHVFSSHVRLQQIETFQEIIETKERIKSMLKKAGFYHYTIETELDNESCSLDFNVMDSEDS